MYGWPVAEQHSLYELALVYCYTGDSLPNGHIPGAATPRDTTTGTGRFQHPPPADADCGSRVRVTALARQATERWGLRCPLRLQSIWDTDWATRARANGERLRAETGNPAIGNAGAKPARGLRAIVEPVTTRRLLSCMGNLQRDMRETGLSGTTSRKRAGSLYSSSV